MIKIDNEALSSGSSSLEKQIDSLESTTNDLVKVAESIAASWKGNSSTAYSERMKVYIEQGRKTIEMLRKYLEYIQKANAEFMQADKDAANKIRSSF